MTGRMIAVAALAAVVAGCASPDVRVVQDVPGYNSWPMVQALGGRLVCAYSRGSAHSIDEPERGVFVRVSDDGGRTWSAESTVVDYGDTGEVTIGKGLDESGAMLLWVRCWGPGKRHELLRSTDGLRFEKWSVPALDPVPMQITDVIRVPGAGLLCLWFTEGYREGSDKAWGTLASADGGRTWTQRTVERGLKCEDWPTEPSGVALGDGRILVVARSERDVRRQFQLVSEDSGRTWRKFRTNITDVMMSTPSLILDAERGLLFNYYYERGARKLKRRVAKADFIFTHPDAWPEPEVLFEGEETCPIDAGNVNVASSGGRHFAALYTGSSSDTRVVIVIPQAAGGRGR